MNAADKWLFYSNLIFYLAALVLLPDDLPNYIKYEFFYNFTLYDAIWTNKAKAPFFKIVTYSGFQFLNFIWALYYLIRTPTWLKGSTAFTKPSLNHILFLIFIFLICSLFFPAISLCQHCFLSFKWFYTFVTFGLTFLLVLIAGMLHQYIRNLNINSY